MEQARELIALRQQLQILAPDAAQRQHKRAVHSNCGKDGGRHAEQQHRPAAFLREQEARAQRVNAARRKRHGERGAKSDADKHCLGTTERREHVTHARGDGRQNGDKECRRGRVAHKGGHEVPDKS